MDVDGRGSRQQRRRRLGSEDTRRVRSRGSRPNRVFHMDSSAESNTSKWRSRTPSRDDQLVVAPPHDRGNDFIQNFFQQETQPSPDVYSSHIRPGRADALPDHAPFPEWSPGVLSSSGVDSSTRGDPLAIIARKQATGLGYAYGKKEYSPPTIKGDEYETPEFDDKELKKQLRTDKATAINNELELQPMDRKVPVMTHSKSEGLKLTRKLPTAREVELTFKLATQYGSGRLQIAEQDMFGKPIVGTRLQDKEILIGGQKVRVWPKGHYRFIAAQNDILELKIKYANRYNIYACIADELQRHVELVQAQCCFLENSAFVKWNEEEDSYIVRNIAMLRGLHEELKVDEDFDSIPANLDFIEEVKRRCPRRTREGIVRRTRYIMDLLERIRAIYDIKLDDDGPDSVQKEKESPVQGLDSNQFNKAVEINHLFGEDGLVAPMLVKYLGDNYGRIAFDGIKLITQRSPAAWTLWEDRTLIRERNRLFYKTKPIENFETIAEALPRRTPKACRMRRDEIKRMYNITYWMVATNMPW